MRTRREIRSNSDPKEHKDSDRDGRKSHDIIRAASSSSVSSFCIGSSRVTFYIIGSCLWGAALGYQWGRFFVEELKAPTLAAALEACHLNGPACFDHFDFDSNGSLSLAELEAALIELRKEAWWLTPDDDKSKAHSLSTADSSTIMDTSVSQTPSTAAKFAIDRLERLRADYAKATAEHHVKLAQSIDSQIAEAESDVADLSVLKEAEIVTQRRLQAMLSQRDFDGAQELESELAALKDLVVRHVGAKKGDNKSGAKGGGGDSTSEKAAKSKHKAHLSPIWNKVLATAAGYAVKRFKSSDGTTTVIFPDGQGARFDPISGYALPSAHDRGRIRLPDGTYGAYDEDSKQAAVMGYPIDHVLSNGTIYVLVQEESASTKKLVGVYIPKKDHILLGDGFILDLMTPDGGLLVRLPDGTIATFDPNTLTATVKDDPPRYKATVRGTIVGKERDTTKRVTCTKNCTVDAQGRLHGPKVKFEVKGGERDGMVYEGEMKHGEVTGSGIAYHDTGAKRYSGEWFEGRPHGRGTKYLADGSVMKDGGWEHGAFKGA